MSHPQPSRPTTPPPPPGPSRGSAWVSSITSTLTETEARELTDAIRAKLDRLVPLVKRAYEGRADRVLGYASWHAYCAVELGGIRIPLADRPAAVAELREAGMSTRAIGSAIGASEATVRRDLATASSDAVERPAKVISLDGRERPATMPARQDVAEQILAEIDRQTERPSTSSNQDLPPAAAESVSRDEQITRRVAVSIARQTAKRIAPDLLTDVNNLIAGSRAGASDVITPELVAALRRAVDVLEAELVGRQLDVAS